MLSINCICCAFGPGSIASRGLLLGAETASRNWRSEWDALSGWSFKRKVHPGIRAWNGTHFPVVVHLETASQFERSFWDTLSVRPTIRKVHPVLSVQTGTRFPRARLLGKRVPDWQDAMRQVAVQQPLQIHVVEPYRQRGLPDACRLQLFREHACRTDFDHGKADERMAVER